MNHLIFKAREVYAPGSRGGKVYWNAKGQWVYGAPPTDFPDPVLHEHWRKRAANMTALKPHIDAYKQKPRPLEMGYGSSGQVAVLSPIPTRAGGHRVTIFGEDGPHYHTEHATVEDALDEHVYDLRGGLKPGTVDKWSQTDKWRQGVASAIAVQAANAAGFDGRDANAAADAARKQFLGKAATFALDDFMKAEKQLGLFGPRKPVQKPGSRGGKGYYAEKGDWRYGERIASTRSGKPIHAPDKVAPVDGSVEDAGKLTHEGYTADDHADAAVAHRHAAEHLKEHSAADRRSARGLITYEQAERHRFAAEHHERQGRGEGSPRYEPQPGTTIDQSYSKPIGRPARRSSPAIAVTTGTRPSSIRTNPPARASSDFPTPRSARSRCKTTARASTETPNSIVAARRSSSRSAGTSCIFPTTPTSWTRWGRHSGRVRVPRVTPPNTS